MASKRVKSWSGIVVLVLVVGLAGVFHRAILGAFGTEAAASDADAPGPYKLEGDVIEAGKDATAPAGIRLAKVELRDVPMTLTLTARSGLNLETVTHVSPQFGGKVVDLSVGLGDAVKGPEDGAPSKLCVIESNDLAQDKAAWLQALIQVKIDEQALKRTQELYRANVLAEKFLLDAESTLMKDQAAQEAARQQLLIFGLKDKEIDDIRRQAVVEPANVAGAATMPAGPEKGTDQIRRERMGYVINSPRSGVVAEKTVSGGEVATPGNNLFTIADTHTLWVWGDVYERDLSRIKVGQPMKAFFTSEPNRARDCRVDWVSPVLDPNTHSVKIRGLIDNSDGHLLSDMYGTMVITVSRGKNSIIVPADAVIHQDEDAFVFVLIGQSGGTARYRRTPVKVEPVDVGFGASQIASAAAGSTARNTLGQDQSTGQVRIAQGLKPDDAIVVSGGVGLFNEMKEQANLLQGAGPTTMP